MAALIRPDLTQTIVVPEDPKSGFSLDELYRLIDCETIEVVTLKDGRVMVMDEDGRAKRLPVNVPATKLYMEAGGLTGWAVVGNVVICEKGEII